MAFSDRKFSELSNLNLDGRDEVKRKHDEVKLRMLRQLASQSSNRQCFDCLQKGPTYVNATIGSFVCTKCSGLLRGLTPPHRVKSISLATFTPQEIELLKERGNSYCSKVWLGLCDENRINEPKNEQQIKDFMIEKYEKKRYYLEPSPDRTVSSSTTSSGSYVMVGSSASGKFEFDRCSQNLSENDEIVSLSNSSSMKKSTTSDDSLFISDSFDIGKSLNSALSLDNIISLSSFSSSNDGVISNGSHGSYNSGRYSNDNSSNEFTADFNNANIIEVAQQFPSDCYANNSREQVEFFSKNTLDYLNQNGGEDHTRETMNSKSTGSRNEQAEDRYAALKDLDLEFKQKQEKGATDATVSEMAAPLTQNHLQEGDLFGSAMSAKNPFAHKNPFNCFSDIEPLIEHNGPSAMRETTSFLPISQSLNFQTVNGNQNPFKIGSVNSVDSVNAFNFNQHHSIMTGHTNNLMNGRNKNNNPFL